MPLPAHHTALAELEGKIYVIGGFIVPRKAQQANLPGWKPIDNAWDYDPRNDAWRALAPLPSKRGSAIAAVVAGKVCAIGAAANHLGAGESYIDRTRGRPSLHRAVATNEVYDPASNRRESRNPMPSARNHGARTTAAFISRVAKAAIINSARRSKRLKRTMRSPTPGTSCRPCKCSATALPHLAIPVFLQSARAGWVARYHRILTDAKWGVDQPRLARRRPGECC